MQDNFITETLSNDRIRNQIQRLRPAEPWDALEESGATMWLSTLIQDADENRLARELINDHGSALKVLEAIAQINTPANEGPAVEHLMSAKLAGADGPVLQRWSSSLDIEKFQSMLQFGSNIGVRFSRAGDTAWPDTLHAGKRNVPIGVWGQGDVDILRYASIGVSIIGPLAPTPQERQVVRQTALEITRASGVVIIDSRTPIGAAALGGTTSYEGLVVDVTSAGAETFRHQHNRITVSASAPGQGGTVQRRTKQDLLLANLGRGAVAFQAEDPSISRRICMIARQSDTPVISVPLQDAARSEQTPRTPRPARHVGLG